MSTAKEEIRSLLSLAGITINGSHSFDIQVHDDHMYSRVLGGGSLAIGESYMDGWWDAEDLPELVHKVLRAGFDNRSIVSPSLVLYVVLGFLFNQQSPQRAKEVAEGHYDLGNDLYQAMLDSRMVYSCGYWKNAMTLEEAQGAKLDLICRKIGLREEMSVLDIGCGWGSFAKFAAEKYGVHVVGTTISREQAAHAKENCRELPVEIRFEDYRVTRGTFDRVVSIGMFEHVGPKNYRVYMKRVNELLKDDGLFLLHTIGGDRSRIASEPWFHKYIFPNGVLPSIKQIGLSIEGVFVMEDWENFSSDYEKTLLAWFSNFEKNWPQLEKKYGKRFYRMWKYYLLSMAGIFRARQAQLWQVVLSKKGVPGGYMSVR